VRVEGKRAIVTGAGSGIGRAASVLLAHEGARVGLVDLDGAAAQATADAIAAEGGDSLVLATDVTDEGQVRGAVATARGAWGGLDVVVANAAVQLFGEDDRVDRLELAVWERTLAVNLTGVFLTCKHGIAALLASGGGSVVVTGSPTGLFGLARVMAADYAAEGVRVNVVVPGFTATPLVESIMASPGERDDVLRKVPLGRPGTAEEVAAMVLFLASDEASFATGGFFSVDGGITAV
jgi:NAD(P)-dependent dehydrogenase (short-subunit alcohol dehydrogenase family)